MADDRFGDIQIDPDFSKEVHGPDVPLSESSGSNEKSPAGGFELPPVQTEKRKAGQRQRQKPPFKMPRPSRRMVVLLSIIPLLVILYSVCSYFFIPLAINSIFLPNLSRHFDRPVEAGRIIFSPFTLELHVENVTVGPLRGDNSGKELLALKNARFHFSVRRIFDGKPVLIQAVIDGLSVHVIRLHDDVAAELSVISDLFIKPSTDQDNLYWPAWLFLDEATVTAGNVEIDDRKAKKVFTVEDIQFYLPSAATREIDKTALPSLRAVIDSSPFEVNAVRFINQSGTWRTGFSFEFKKLIVSNFKELFPFPDTGMLLSDGEVDIHLDIILPEDQHGPDTVVVEGEANFRNVKWHDPESQAVLTLPEARIVYHVTPADKFVRLSIVEFHEPELILAGSKETAGRELLAAVAFLKKVLENISRAEEIIEVESFLWNNGKVVMSRGGKAGGKSELNDVTFVMEGFTTAGHRRMHADPVKSARYTFRAKDITAKKITSFIAEGQFAFAGSLYGKIEVTGLDLERYPFLLPKSPFILQKGITDISFTYDYAGSPANEQSAAASQNKIYQGKIKTTKFVLIREGKKAAAGETLECRDFNFDMLSGTILCNKLELVSSDIFSDPLFNRKKGKGNDGDDTWQFKINDLAVSNSTIHTSLKGIAAAEPTSLVAQKVSIEGKNLQAEKISDNIKASASIGKKGKLRVNGSYSANTGQGSLQITLAEMELSLLHPYFSTWFIPKVNSGMVAASGSLQLPEREFKGKVAVDHFDSGEGNSARASWKHALSNDFAYRAEPLHFAMEEMVIQHLSLNPGLSSGEKPMWKYLRVKDNALPQSVRIGKIRLEKGEFSLSEPVFYPGYQPVLQNIDGTLSSVKDGGLDFAINGMINDQSSFTLQGKGTMSSIFSYRLEVQNFPLTPFDSILKKEAGFSGLQSVATFTQESSRENNFTKVSTDIIVRQLDRESIRSTAPVLPLLINDEQFFEMKMEGQYSADKPRPFLLEQLFNRLRHFEIKAGISPRLVLKSTLPSIEIPEFIVFTPGSSLFEEPTISLSDYKELLQKRPFIELRLRGQYDPVTDREILQAELQNEADRQREIENKRRALEKIRILQQEKRQLKELETKGPGVIIEEIVPGDTSIDLSPLPEVKVSVDPSSLEDLARKRAHVMEKYLLRELKLPPERIKVEPEVVKGSSSVQIRILPHSPSEGAAQ